MSNAPLLFAPSRYFMASRRTALASIGAFIIVLLPISWLECSSAFGESEHLPAPTFTRDVLPILQEHCQVCHRPGEVAPMSLTSYEEVRPWAKAIRKAVASKTMPPFHAAGPIGRYENDLRLTEAQIDLIRRWIDSGVRRGDPSDAPRPPEFDDGEWKLGEPDLILEFPPYHVAGEKQDYEIVLYHPDTFDTDMWIQGVEYLPGHRKYVHHAGIFAVPADRPLPEDRIAEATLEENRFLISGATLVTWLPGAGPRIHPEGQALRIPEGSRIALQLHFAPYGESFDEVSRVGFKFADGIIRENCGSLVRWDTKIVIPPGDSHYESRSKSYFRHDGLVHAFQVHMHLRGKSSTAIFHYPDGRSETVFEMPQYDFDWQRYYRLVEPIKVTKNTRVEYIAVWDNSENNPDNPDPTKEVTWGAKTTDEMHTNEIVYSWKREVPLLVEKGVPVRLLHEEAQDRPGAK